jgi:hypothetical protein
MLNDVTEYRFLFTEWGYQLWRTHRVDVFFKLFASVNTCISTKKHIQAQLLQPQELHIILVWIYFESEISQRNHLPPSVNRTKWLFSSVTYFDTLHKHTKEILWQKHLLHIFCLAESPLTREPRWTCSIQGAISEFFPERQWRKTGQPIRTRGLKHGCYPRPSVVRHSWWNNKHLEINRFLAQTPPTLQHCSCHPRFFNPHSIPGRLASRALASAPLSPRDQLHVVWGRGRDPRAVGGRGGIQGVVRHVSRSRGMGCRTQITTEWHPTFPNRQWRILCLHIICSRLRGLYKNMLRSLRIGDRMCCAIFHCSGQGTEFDFVSDKPLRFCMH